MTAPAAISVCYSLHRINAGAPYRGCAELGLNPPTIHRAQAASSRLFRLVFASAHPDERSSASKKQIRGRDELFCGVQRAGMLAEAAENKQTTKSPTCCTSRAQKMAERQSANIDSEPFLITPEKPYILLIDTRQPFRTIPVASSRIRR